MQQAFEVSVVAAELAAVSTNVLPFDVALKNNATSQ
jgi:hypothetical protein